MNRNPVVQPTKLTTRRVTITAVDLTTGTGQARDTNGKTLDLRVDRRPKGTAAPAVGELWEVELKGYCWVLAEQIGTPPPPTVTGSRAGVDPLTLSLLDALASLGHVIDGTTD